MTRQPRYVSPMPRHRRTSYRQWAAEIESGLAADRPGELPRLLNSAALLFAEHHRRPAAVDCLLAQLVLADEGDLGAEGDLDAFINLVRLSLAPGAAKDAAVGFWLNALVGRESGGHMGWLRARAALWREAVVDTLVQDALRAERFASSSCLTDLAARVAPGLPEQSRTLRQEYLARAGVACLISGETEVFLRVVAPLTASLDGGPLAAEAATSACRGLRDLADRIDGSWWRAIAATSIGLPATPAWLDDRIAGLLAREPLLAADLPLDLARRFIDPANLVNERLAPSELDVLQVAVAGRLAGVSDRAAGYAQAWPQGFEARPALDLANGNDG